MTVEPTNSVLFIEGPSPFYSRTDEDHFFAWLQSIPAIKRVTGKGRGLELVVERPIDRESLRDLIAVMTRYDLDCRPLRPLCDEQKDEYFRDEGKYWHSAVYG
ncbi:MAG: hypothetical protein ACXWKP_26595 [Bradyrhizobium sp.]